MRILFYLVLLPALLPVFIILHYVYSKDKVDREPFMALAITFGLGALFSFADIPLERIAQNIIFAQFGTPSIEYELCENIFGVALIEELTKWAVIMVFVWKLRDFDYRYDGVVYCVTASLGFAGMENILYILSYGTSVSISRAIFAIPGHASFGVFMGFFMARAKHWDIRGIGFLKFFALIFSIFFPMMIHGIYDFLLSPAAEQQQFSAYFTAYVIVIDILSWLIIHHEFRTDRPLGYKKIR